MPNSHDDEVARRLALARDAAEAAGRITLKYFQTEFERETKRDGTVVTIADKQAEQRIRSLVKKNFPEDGVLGEEFEESKGKSRYRWIIDPIDGTLSFASGVPLYGVLIGIEDQELRACPAGVVHLPALGEMLYAQSGRGCTWTKAGGRKKVSRPARVSSVDALEKAMLLSTDFWKAPSDARLDGLSRLAARVRVCRTWADCYGYVLVATGRADLMLDSAMHIWDCAPLQPILEEAGGSFTDWSGKSTIYGDCALATNSRLMTSALEALA